MCLCGTCVCTCECWLLNFWGGKPRARRAVKLLTTEGDVGGSLHWGISQCDTEVATTRL